MAEKEVDINDALYAMAGESPPSQQPSSEDADIDINDALYAMMGEKAPSEYASKGDTVYEVAAKGGTAGVIRGTTATAGAIAGAKGGAAVGAFGGPIGAGIGGVAGGIIGGIGGYFAGDELVDVAADYDLAYRDIDQDVAPDLRSSAIFGENIGGSLPMIAAPYTGLLRNSGGNFFGRMFNNMTNAAMNKPYTFASYELTSAVSSGFGGGMAEEMLPGNPYARMGGEVSGGLILAPLKFMLDKGLNRASAIWSSMSLKSRENRLAGILQTALDEAGEDPSAIVRLLKDPDIMGLDLTAAQKTGSPVLAAFEQLISKGNAKFGAEAAKKSDDFINATALMITALRSTGDPELMQQAIKLQDTYIKGLLEARLATAVDEVKELSKRIANEPQVSKLAISREARAIFDKAIDDSKTHMSKLWDEVVEFDTTTVNTLEQYRNLEDEILESMVSKRLPAYVRKTLGITDKVAVEKNISSKELIKLRSELLGESRKLRAAGDDRQAGILEKLAGSVLDDLDASGIDNEAYQLARRFTRQYHEVFSRSFVGKIEADTKYGDMIPPDSLFAAAWKTGPEARHAAFLQMEDAIKFMAKNGIVDEKAVEPMMTLQGRYIRLVAAEAVDPETGMVSSKGLSKFMNEPSNQEMLKKFPEAEALFKKAISSKRALASLEADQKQMLTTEYLKSITSKFANGQPVTLLGEAIASDFPEKELVKIINVVKKGGENAIDGLRVSALEMAMRNAKDTGGKINVAMFRQYLFEPIRPGTKSVIQVLKQNGVMQAQDVKRIDEFLKQAEKVLATKKPGTAVEKIDDLPGMFISAMARITGSKLASAVASVTGTVSGSSLVIAGIGARLNDDLLKKVPQMKLEALLTQALTDRDLMIRLLEKDVPVERAIENGFFIHAWLLQSGAFNASQAIMSEEESNMISESAMSAM